MRRYRDYRDELRKRGVPFGKPWVTRVSDTDRQAETNEDSARGEASVARAEGNAKTNVFPMKRQRKQ